jgi:hypothetical protein
VEQHRDMPVQFPVAWIMDVYDRQWRSQRGFGGSRTPPPPIMLENISDQKKLHAIVLRLYTYDILFATSRLS